MWSDSALAILGVHRASYGLTEKDETALWNVAVSHVQIWRSVHFVYKYIILSFNRTPIITQFTEENRIWWYYADGVVWTESKLALTARTTYTNIDTLPETLVTAAFLSTLKVTLTRSVLAKVNDPSLRSG